MSAQTIEAEPQLKQDILVPSGQSISMNGLELDLFVLPEDPNRRGADPRELAISNVDGFGRLMTDGISGLEDDEPVVFSSATNNDGTVRLSSLYTFERHGDAFVIKTLDTPVQVPAQAQAPSSEIKPLAIEDGLKRISGFFNQQLFVQGGRRGLELSGIGGKLGDTVNGLGFTSEEKDSELPLPETLRRNIESLQDAGVNVPNVKFFKDGAIDGDDYLKAWADGEFPASEHPGYFAHDLLSEHFRPLIVFREDVMGIATLYARAVQEVDEIVAEIPASDYEINKEHPEMADVTLSGREKIDHAAVCLDNLTTEFADVADVIELAGTRDEISVACSENPPHSWRYLPQMVRTILNSSHRDEFISHLDSFGSEALDKETGEFDYETYMREIHERAQEFWDITPKQPESPRSINYGDAI